MQGIISKNLYFGNVTSVCSRAVALYTASNAKVEVFYLKLVEN